MSNRSVSPCIGPSGDPLLPIWSPADSIALREAVAEFPCEIGNSVVLDLIVGCENLR